MDLVGSGCTRFDVGLPAGGAANGDRFDRSRLDSHRFHRYRLGSHRLGKHINLHRLDLGDFDDFNLGTLLGQNPEFIYFGDLDHLDARIVIVLAARNSPISLVA